MHIELKRVYDLTASTKGYRVLVDRIWPRGIKKEALSLDEWCKDLAPSNELRKWFGHDSDRWGQFRFSYIAELKSKAVTLERLRQISENKRLILLYSARDREHNQAVVIRDLLLGDG
jgi:uncharacterized protein YeaO (DUF488 family)